jgi:hypothetical protein
MFQPDTKRSRIDWTSVVRATLENVEPDESGFRIIPTELVENYDADKVRGYALAITRTLAKFPAFAGTVATSGTLPDGSRGVAIK